MLSLFSREWWERPCGGRSVMRLALPLVVSTASWTLMHFVDRVFLARYSNVAIAAAMPAGMLHFTIVCLPLGTASYVTTFVAQYHGAGRSLRIGHVLWQGIFLGVITTPLLLLTIPLAPAIFAYAGHPPTVEVAEVSYFQRAGLRRWGGCDRRRAHRLFYRFRRDPGRDDGRCGRISAEYCPGLRADLRSGRFPRARD